eukprot:9151227-Pyramimonas_sp.AAC.1
MQSSDRSHARKQLRAQVASWRFHGTISSLHPLFADVTCLARGGRQANLPAVVTAVDTSLTDNNSTMYTVVYNPETKRVHFVGDPVTRSPNNKRRLFIFGR